MIAAVLAIVVGMFAVLMYISDGSPGEYFSDTTSYDRICVSSLERADARERGYRECLSMFDRKRCKKRDRYSTCMEKKLER